MGTAADGNNPVRLEFLHGSSALHDGLHRRVGLDSFKQGNFHAGFLQIGFGTIQESETFHRTAADTDHGAFAGQRFEGFQRVGTVIQVAG